MVHRILSVVDIPLRIAREKHHCTADHSHKKLAQEYSKVLLMWPALQGMAYSNLLELKTLYNYPKCNVYVGRCWGGVLDMFRTGWECAWENGSEEWRVTMDGL